MLVSMPAEIKQYFVLCFFFIILTWKLAHCEFSCLCLTYIDNCRVIQGVLHNINIIYQVINTQSLNNTFKLFKCYMTQGLSSWFNQVHAFNHIQRCVRLNVCNYVCVYVYILAPGGCFYRWQSGSTRGWDSCLHVWTSSCFQRWGNTSQQDTLGHWHAKALQMSGPPQCSEQTVEGREWMRCTLFGRQQCMGLRAWTAGYNVRVCCKKVHFDAHQVI